MLGLVDAMMRRVLFLFPQCCLSACPELSFLFRKLTPEESDDSSPLPAFNGVFTPGNERFLLFSSLFSQTVIILFSSLLSSLGYSPRDAHILDKR